MKVFGFTGFSGSGKTTLLEQMIPLFVQKGLRVSLIKHAHHKFDIDKPGQGLLSPPRGRLHRGHAGVV